MRILLSAIALKTTLFQAGEDTHKFVVGALASDYVSHGFELRKNFHVNLGKGGKVAKVANFFPEFSKLKTVGN